MHEMIRRFSPHDPFGKFLAMIEYDPHEDDMGKDEFFETVIGWVMDRPDWWPGWETAGITRAEVLLDIASKADAAWYPLWEYEQKRIALYEELEIKPHKLGE